MIAFLGMGLLGANFVRACLSRGQTVQVWNRTAEKARALEPLGARVLTDVADAVRGATRIHLTLSDDAAVDAVLEHARPAILQGALIVDHTTTSVGGARVRAAQWKERGMGYQHAPVFMGPQNALNATGVMLASGDHAQFDALQPELAKMTGKLVYLGDDPGRAAAFKLLGNLFLMFMTAGITELLTLAKALDIAPEEAAKLFEVFNPAVTLGPRLERVLSAEFGDPSWELAMARKDARLMVEEAEQGGVPLSMLPAIAAVMDGMIERGHGRDDWTVIAKDALAR